MVGVSRRRAFITTGLSQFFTILDEINLCIKVDNQFFKQFYLDGIISDESYENIAQKKANPLISIHWEIKALLYVGILLLTTGLGIFVYKNIDTIGHQFILALIALISIGCFAYCFKYKKPFSFYKVESPTTFFDYLLLLGTLSFLIFIGYLQYQYEIFGINYGMATFIPMLVLYCVAYGFDHIGILNMAIVNMGLWLGITITPKALIAQNTFDSATAIYTYLGFGLLLLAFGEVTKIRKLKNHFTFSYQHYGVHVSFIALLAGYFFYHNSPFYFLWLIGVFVLGYIIYLQAFKNKSFYFLVLVILYSYIAFSILVMRVFDIESIYFITIYFITSALGMVYLLMRLNKKLKEA